MSEVYSPRLRAIAGRGRARRLAAAASMASTRRRRAQLRNAGRDPILTDDRGRRRRDVDRPRSHRRATHGHGSARPVVHQQHGRRRCCRSRSITREVLETTRRRAAGHFRRCWRESLDSSDRNRLSVTVVDVADGKEAEFVALAEQFGALLVRKKYGDLRDDPRRGASAAASTRCAAGPMPPRPRPAMPIRRCRV